MQSETVVATALEKQYADAVAVVLKKNRATVELLHREIGVSLIRAEALIGEMVDRGVLVNEGKKFKLVVRASQTSATETPSPTAGQTIAFNEDGSMNWRKITSGEHLIPLELVVASAEQARKTFDENSIRMLADNIHNNGGVNKEPATVRPFKVLPLELEDGAALGLEHPAFELIGGERRHRALRMNGATHILARVVACADESLHLDSMLLNMNREDLNPLDEGAAYAREMASGRYKSVGELAQKLGRSDHERSIRDLISLQELFPGARLALLEKRISNSHAVLIAREPIEDQPRVLEACFRPEARDNGAGLETVPVLNSEKQLRQWIQDNLRAPEKELPTFVDSETEAEKQGDGTDTAPAQPDSQDDTIDENASGTSQSPDVVAEAHAEFQQQQDRGEPEKRVEESYRDGGVKDREQLNGEKLTAAVKLEGNIRRRILGTILEKVGEHDGAGIGTQAALVNFVESEFAEELEYNPEGMGDLAKMIGGRDAATWATWIRTLSQAELVCMLIGLKLIHCGVAREFNYKPENRQADLLNFAKRHGVDIAECERIERGEASGGKPAEPTLVVRSKTTGEIRKRLKQLVRLKDYEKGWIDDVGDFHAGEPDAKPTTPKAKKVAKPAKKIKPAKSSKIKDVIAKNKAKAKKISPKKAAKKKR